MKISKLKLENFKGIESLEIEANGKNLAIYGDNGTGKTTIADAYAWVMFGKSFDGRALEPEIKKRDEKGTLPNDGGVIHAVEIELMLDSDKPMTLRKEYVEVWTKKRGAANKEYTGDKTNYFINDVPMQKKEYDKTLEAVFPNETGRLLSMPLYFCNNLGWQDRRKILMDICGTISDADIISSVDELKPLADVDTSIDDYRKTLKAKAKKVNDELETIPARIDELEKAADINVDEPKDVLEARVKELSAKRDGLFESLSNMEHGGITAAYTKELANIEAEQTKIVGKVEAEISKRKREAESVARGYEAEIKRITDDIARLDKNIEQLGKIVSTADTQAQKLRDEWNVENEKQPNITVSDVCPCCGQKLPPEKVEETRQKAIADFNVSKAASLEEITAKGKRLMEQKEKDVKEIDLLTNRVKELEQEIKTNTDKLESTKAFLSIEPDDISQNEKWSELEHRRVEVMKKMDSVKNEEGLAEEIRSKKAEIESLGNEISAACDKLAAYVQAEQLKARKAELLTKERELGRTYSEIEHMIFLTEQFYKEKVRRIEDSVNSKFSRVKFLLFKQQKNGGIDECCEPTIDGVPVGIGLNKGAEMTAALDIVNTLSKHYEMNLPVIVDNCESYTDASMINVDSQLIRLIVKAGQKELDIQQEG